MKATEKQLNYILMLCNQISGGSAGYLSQCRDIHGWGSFKLQRGVTFAEASAMIDKLKAQLEAKA